ncbi:branched-chain amino acid ABC transporter permease [Rhodoligotrophos ferricapiens]|uniref:branched-chain amino acid ABC transporter permease n=1 Tax=Rhodoligotrophos ferricapiens TaxID=3069264 RepID=UPI00315C942E
MTTSFSKMTGIGLMVLAAILLPFLTDNIYYIRIATLIGIYWVLVAGLNLVIGYCGQISIGHVGLLAMGAYCFAILAGKLGIDPWLSMLAAGAVGGACGMALGLPSLRLPGFYFAMTTLAFAMIVTELSIAWEWLTGGGVGMMAPAFPGQLGTPSGFYWMVLAIGVIVSWLVWNLTRSSWGRAMISVRDSEVAAASVGVPIYRLKLYVFTFSGVLAGIAGALFASYQSYITPETFVFELSMFFFVCIVVGGRGSLIGPFIGTVVLAALPEVVAPLAHLGNFFYGVLLLLVVLLVPEGFGNLFQIIRDRIRPLARDREGIRPDLGRLSTTLQQEAPKWRS